MSSILRRWGAWGILGGVFLNYFYLLWWHADFTTIDIPGHIASAAAVGRGLYHQFEKNFFLGSIHGLFYPPLEDFIGAVFLRMFSDPIIAWKTYLSVLGIFYFSALVAFIRWTVVPDRRWLASLWISLFLMGSKVTLAVQGLGFVELLETGLSAQILGFSFLLFWLCEAVTRRRWWWLGVLGALIMLSHIVSGMIYAVFGLVLFYYLKGHRRAVVLSGLVSALGSATLWLPFLFYRKYSTTAFIEPMHLALTVLLMLWVVLQNRSISSSSLSSSPSDPKLPEGDMPAASFLLRSFIWFMVGLIPVLSLLSYYDLLKIPFHWYRFNAYALVLMAPLASAWTLRKDFFAILCAFALLCDQFSPWNLNSRIVSQSTQTDWYRVKKTAEDFPILPEGGRILAISHRRAVDSGLESWMTFFNPKLMFVKGLFWESNYTNPIFSSFSAYLFSPETVTDALRSPIGSVEKSKCIFRQLLRTYGVSHVIYPTDLDVSYLTYDRSLGFLASVKDFLEPTKIRFFYSGRDYTVATVKEPFPFEQKFQEKDGFSVPVSKLAGSRLNSWEVLIQHYFDRCTYRNLGEIYYTGLDDLSKTHSLDSKIVVKKDSQNFSVLKFSDFPGLTMRGGGTYPFVSDRESPGSPLLYKKPALVKFSEYLTILTFFILAIFGLVNIWTNRKSRNLR